MTEIKKCTNGCMFSKSMHQEYPRKCVNCNASEHEKMTEKQVFTKDNLSALLRLRADALDRGEVLEFEEGGKLVAINVEPYHNSGFIIENVGWFESITLKPKPQLRKATAMEWLEFSCSKDVFGWLVRVGQDDKEYITAMTCDYTYGDINLYQRAKFENGKLGEFDYFWKEV